MNKTDQSNGSESKPDQGWTPDSVQFCSIEEMQDISEAEGWSVKYRQIESGVLKTHSTPGSSGSISLLAETASLRLEVVGRVPEAHVAVLAPVGSSRIWANGHWIDSQSVLVLDDSCDLHVLTDPDARVLSMHVPSSFLDDSCSSLFEDWNGIRATSTKMNGDTVQSIQEIRQLINDQVYDPVRGHWQNELEDDLACRLGAIMEQFARRPKVSRLNGQNDRARVLKRSKDFFEAHIDQSIAMGQLCNYASASISKVGRIFRRELGITPGQYMMARRLAAVRAELKCRTAEETNVTLAATKYGFHHLSRFSGLYRTQFGESPSDTLRSS